MAWANAARTTTWIRANVPGQRAATDAATAAKLGVDGVDGCRCDIAEGERTEVRMEIAVENGPGLADRGRRPPAGSDREPRLQQLAYG
jgi:hypothetical protein